MHGVQCTIVAPHDAPKVKLNNARNIGAHIILSTPIGNENREVAAARRAEEYAQETGGVLLHPFDDWGVIYGQGTVAVEVVEDLQKMGVQADLFLTSAGGGGLTAGCCIALSKLSPTTRIHCVEPEVSMYVSLAHILSHVRSSLCVSLSPSGLQ